MELGIQSVGPYEQVLEVALWTQARGLAAFAVPDHYLYGEPVATGANPAPDALVQLAGLARDTSSIELVSLVSPVTFRHPSVHPPRRPSPSTACPAAGSHSGWELDGWMPNTKCLASRIPR